VPLELTIVAIGALFAGVLVIGVVLTGGSGIGRDRRTGGGDPLPAAERPDGTNSPRGVEATLRLVWWITITIVLVGVGISGSFEEERGAIFALGAVAVAAVIVFHELKLGRTSRFGRAAEAVAAIGLVAGLLVLTGSAASPFSMLFALVAVAAALAHGPRAGLAAAGLSTAAFAAVVATDPNLASYGPDDALRLSVGLGATWLLTFISIAYAAHHRRGMALSLTDPLTGLLNRSQLFDTLEREVSRTRRSDRGFCLLMVDLDGLKALNDGAGHLAGDRALAAIGAVVTHSIRTVDSAYRYGGDEFVVLLPETDIVGAFVVAEKIRIGAEEVGMTVAQPELALSVSIGLVSHPEDGSTAEELIGAADRAMYQAKRFGKNQISGNPRPRPPLLPRVATTTAPSAAPIAVGEPAVATTPPEAPDEPRAIAVELGPIVADGRAEDDDEAEAAVAAAREPEEDEADPLEVRQRIATASRSFDPDDQIRRAMEAFLSPAATHPERRTPDA
jgi:diguanylate cyclase (GGDEF)-like protein